MKELRTSPLAGLILALLLIYGGCRLLYVGVQTSTAREDDLRAMRAEQGRVVKQLRPLLRDGNEKEIREALDAAVATGQTRRYSVAKDGKVLAELGDWREQSRASSDADVVEVGADVGNFSVRLGDRWSFFSRLLEGVLGLGAEGLGIAVGVALVWIFRRRLALPVWADKENAAPPPVRILREPRERTSPPEASHAHPSVSFVEEVFECALVRGLFGDLGGGGDNLSVEACQAVSTEVSEVADRYGGRVVSVSGHEFICVFRETGDGQSAALALSAARDIRQAVGKLPTPVPMMQALAHGIVRSALVGGEAQLVGSPFLDTAKLEIAVGARAGVIVLTDRLAKLVVPLLKVKPIGEGGRQYSYVDHPPLASALDRARRNMATGLDYFHADEHLETILQSLDETWPLEAFVGAIGRLRLGKYRRSSAGVRTAYTGMLQREMKQPNSYRLSSVLALAPHLFTSAAVDKSLYDLFLKALTVTDRRIKSNAIELFIQLFPGREVAEVRAHLKDVDHRVSANVLIKMALERFDDKVVRAIQDRIRGGSVAHVASALFALGEIAAYYKQSDPVYLSTKSSFLRIFEELPLWAKHPNTMVRRQALVAAKKLADEKLTSRIRLQFESSADPDQLALYEAVYGWQKDEKPKVA